MTDTKRCEVCGDRIRRDNIFGVCTDASKPECLEARNRKRREQAAESRPAPTRFCEVCGDPILSNNTYGICSDLSKPACEKARRLKREGRTEEEQKTCDICGRPLRIDNRTGICTPRGVTSECSRVRKRMDRGAADPRGTRYLIVIKPGDTFNLWTALEEYNPKRKDVLCRCACGRERPVRAASLVHDASRSCGCGPYRARRMEGPYIAAGDTLNLLTAIEDVASCNDYARFSCKCGGEATVKASAVKSGLTRSCGCLLRRLGGFSKHPLYSTWASMIQRCTNPNHKGYVNYGGRNIPVTVCDRWRDPWLFAEDVIREIGPRPEGRDEKGRVLFEFDRTNNDLGYWCGRCPDCASKGQVTINVRWSDKKTQLANRRTVANLTLERDTHAAGEAALAAEVAALKAQIAGTLF